MERLESRVAVDRHLEVRLGEQAAEHLDDAIGATQSAPVHIMPANADRRGPQRDRLDNIGPGPNAGIEQSGDFAGGCTTAGNISIAATPPFACRPPWVEQ